MGSSCSYRTPQGNGLVRVLSFLSPRKLRKSTHQPENAGSFSDLMPTKRRAVRESEGKRQGAWRLRGTEREREQACAKNLQYSASCLAPLRSGQRNVNSYPKNGRRVVVKHQSNCSPWPSVVSVLFSVDYCVVSFTLYPACQRQLDYKDRIDTAE